MESKNKERPVGVSILAILYYISAGFTFLFGIALIIGASMMASLLSSVPELSALSGGLISALGAVVLLFGVLYLFVGLGLWKVQQWARIVTIVFYTLGTLSGIINLVFGDFSATLGLAISGFLLWYMGFSQGVKSAFSQ